MALFLCRSGTPGRLGDFGVGQASSLSFHFLDRLEACPTIFLKPGNEAIFAGCGQTRTSCCWWVIANDFPLAKTARKTWQPASAGSPSAVCLTPPYDFTTFKTEACGLNRTCSCFCDLMIVFDGTSRNTDCTDDFSLCILDGNSAGEGNQTIVGMLDVIQRPSWLG